LSRFIGQARGESEPAVKNGDGLRPARGDDRHAEIECRPGHYCRVEFVTLIEMLSGSPLDQEIKDGADDRIEIRTLPDERGRVTFGAVTTAS
jgi:hypothetical protein